MAALPRRLQGLTILVVEDSFLIAETIRELLTDCGAEVVGPVPRVAEALKRIDGVALDGAMLDINLAGEYCFPLATALGERGVPFIFLTGYDESSLIPPALRGVPRLPKPFEPAAVAQAAERCFLRPPYNDLPQAV